MSLFYGSRFSRWSSSDGGKKCMSQGELNLIWKKKNMDAGANKNNVLGLYDDIEN